MPEWIWILSLFVALTTAYFAGFAAGSWKTDRSPSENAWINVRKYSIDANTECAKLELKLSHEEQMELINRGVLDQINVLDNVTPEEENDDPD